MIRVLDEGDEEIKLSNGMTIKIEYWMCENFKDVFGRYGSNFRKTILLDSDGNIISEVFEKNPHVRSSKDFAGVSVYDPNDPLIY